MDDGLYNARDEHDACGVGFIVNINGEKSHLIIEQGVEILENLLHRGADSGDDNSGDGAGILVQIPFDFFRREAHTNGIDLSGSLSFAVGSFFMPNDKTALQDCRRITEKIVTEARMKFLGWRKVPVSPDVLGRRAGEQMPVILHAYIGSDYDEDEFERNLYVARRMIEKDVMEHLPGQDSFYIPSLSCRMINYKGMMKGDQIRGFYTDLRDESFVSAMAVIHQRYSTNTFPSWKLAQPFRLTAHNGEINTIRGNIKHMHSREKTMKSALLGADLKKLMPVIDNCGSDSGCLDNVLELLTAAGRELPLAMMMLIPQAWGEKYPLGPDLRGFFEYHAGLMEPWDGPAALVCANGNQIVAMLDRNGLRPARYTITTDGCMVLASETGVLEIPVEKIAERGSLRPGQLIAVDISQKRVQYDDEIKRHYARIHPYRRWVNENRIDLHGFSNDISGHVPDRENRFFKHKLFGYSREDIQRIINPMASEGHEPVGAMGYDAPLAVLSEKPQLVYAYFKQIFSQVTNPPIDPIREELVMSLMTFMGNSPNILHDTPENARLIKLRSPIISNENLARIKKLDMKDFRAYPISIGFVTKTGVQALEKGIDEICAVAEKYARQSDKAIIILSDCDLPTDQAAIPALLAVSAVSQHLSRLGLRSSRSIIVETGEAREVQHMALLLGYGATAINPRLAFETVAWLAFEEKLNEKIGVVRALENYIKALDKGLLKIMSKMGISTLRSYRGSQIFEAVGLSGELIDRYFPGTPSNIDGIGLEEIYADIEARHNSANNKGPGTSKILESGGCYSFRTDGERHLWTPESITKLQQAAWRNDETLYKEYTALIDESPCTLRTLLDFRECDSIALNKVEPAESIMKRFVTSAMSFGSISSQAHETLAIAMNRIGAMSNSGEGGEDRERYKPLPNGDNRCSATKQLASGRFGVTTEYLVNARDLQIKIAQGAKPGEGGQLPGHKVDKKIAMVRSSTPGVTLISPPPHHDIYSIEDIKQLIFDLKNVNPEARVSVKLVSESGVGTVAAGVAKGGADMILISGGDGGTGAAPLTSIKYTGAPWEIGLAETQQVLVRNNLRGGVRLQVDGQMKTGRDVVIGALLGGEEFGFGTCPLVVCGCIMLRHCNKNNCSTGIATQCPELCKRFSGRPEYVVNFFRMLADEVRGYMARLGIAKFDDLIGRADLLVERKNIRIPKARSLNFSKVLYREECTDRHVRCVSLQKQDTTGFLDVKMIEESEVALKKKKPVKIEMRIKSTDRTVCAMLSGRIAKLYGAEGLPDGTISCIFRGYAGQSFAAFGMKGINIRLEGEANDYVAKGLSGAKVVIVPPESDTVKSSENVICGNVAAYGATSGELYICGKAGERFAVRNSGITAVVECVGDHCCEYMTGGRVVVLGDTGINFAAGMSGGLAYVYDPENHFDGRCNLEMVDLENISDARDATELRQIIARHREETSSRLADRILSNWENEISHFVKVFPMEYRRVLGLMSREDEEVERQEDWTR